MSRTPFWPREPWRYQYDIYFSAKSKTASPAKNAARKSKRARRERCTQPARMKTCRTSDSPCGSSCRPMRPHADMPLRNGPALAPRRTGKTHVADAPQGSLARCEGGLVCGCAEPYRRAPYKAVRKLRTNGQSPKRGIPPPFATDNTVKEWLRKAESRFSRPSAASAGRFVPPQHAG